MTKEKRHKKAEEFRSVIALPNQRAAAIRELTAKSDYDESDELRLTILLQKTDYVQGCEKDYTALVSKLIAGDKGKLKDKALAFYRKWHG